MTDINPEILERFRRAFTNVQPKVTLEANRLRINTKSGSDRKTFNIPLTPRSVRGFGYSK